MKSLIKFGFKETKENVFFREDYTIAMRDRKWKAICHSEMETVDLSEDVIDLIKSNNIDQFEKGLEMITDLACDKVDEKAKGLKVTTKKLLDYATRTGLNLTNAFLQDAEFDEEGEIISYGKEYWNDKLLRNVPENKVLLLKAERGTDFVADFSVIINNGVVESYYF